MTREYLNLCQRMGLLQREVLAPLGYWPFLVFPSVRGAEPYLLCWRDLTAPYSFLGCSLFLLPILFWAGVLAGTIL